MTNPSQVGTPIEAESLQYKDEMIGDFGTPVHLEDSLPKPLAHFANAVDRVSEISGKLVSLLILILVGVILTEIFLRSVLNAPSIWAYDVSYMIYGTVFMIGSAATLRYGGHIRTDIFFSKFSEITKAKIDIFFYLFLFIPGIALFFWVGLEKTIHSFTTNEHGALSPWRPIIWPFRAVIPLTAALLILQGISEMIKRLGAFSARGKK